MSDYYKHWTKRIFLFESKAKMYEHDYEEKKRKFVAPFYNMLGVVVFFFPPVWFIAGWKATILASLILIIFLLTMMWLAIEELLERLAELGDIYVFDRAPQEQKEEWRRSESNYDEGQEWKKKMTEENSRRE